MIGSARDLPSSHWLNYADPQFPTSPIGYLFLQGSPKVSALLEDRSGAWNELDKGGTTYGDLSLKINRFFSIAYQHGTNLTDMTSGAYAYVILPGRDAAQTEAENTRQRQGLKILRNDSSAAVAQDDGLGLVGANIWSLTDAVTQTTNSVKINGADGELLIDVNGLMSFTMRYEKAYELRIAITATYVDDGPVRLAVNIKSKTGLSHDVRLRLKRTDPLAASGTFAATNNNNSGCE